MHHIVSDGWSMGLFLQELTALYNAYIQGLSRLFNPLSIHMEILPFGKDNG
jgi:hypothetical protein